MERCDHGVGRWFVFVNLMNDRHARFMAHLTFLSDHKWIVVVEVRHRSSFGQDDVRDVTEPELLKLLHRVGSASERVDVILV